MSKAKHWWAHLDGGAWRCPDYVEPPGKRNPTAGCGTGDEQGTPLWLFDLLNREFRFDCDMFASHQNALCSTYHTITHQWHTHSPGRVLWANVPFGTGTVGPAMEAVARAALAGRTVVALHRDEPGAKWHQCVWDHAHESRRLDVRLKFRGQRDSYNFPCSVSVFRGGARWASHPLIDIWRVSAHRPRNSR